MKTISEETRFTCDIALQCYRDEAKEAIALCKKCGDDKKENLDYWTDKLAKIEAALKELRA